jgi:NAD+-processing family protein with receiver domain
MTYRLFIDDERFPAEDGKVWIVARSSAEAILLFYNLGAPKFISFDHDLGGKDTAIIYVDWIIEATLDLLELGIDPGLIRFPTEYTIHSQNPIGAADIEAKMKRFIYHLDSI